ncbi:hypothetical protein A9Q99_12495 [Gammaproteobacteria bacterium 45_16_T64]|nr:hypothetical protein A9Q99_12495 [Gammaproteobacteria bacterium 45_16_T64]
MSYIVDRRLNGKNKSTVNRQRFLRRYRKNIKKAVDDAVTKRSITDIESGESVSIPKKDLSEPIFHHGKGGIRDMVHPGNKEFIEGDKIPRPPGGSGSGGGEGEASDTGEGMDEFVFQISQDEFLEFLFDGLELPNLIKRQLQGIESFKYVRAGIVNDGTPTKLNIVRSMRQATSRRIALTAPTRKKIKNCLEEIEKIEQQEPAIRDNEKIRLLQEEIERLRKKIKGIPFIDDFDLRYNHHVKQPVPTSKAVMFCLMDVSGSMNQAMKDMAKRFFILLYMFLKRNYEKIEVVFIRHHTSAKEVDEEEFFYSRETGGTIVSSALKMMQEIMSERYPVDEWNIYGAQASDGDNWNDDSPTCKKILQDDILPQCQYFSYIEITPRRHQALWREYETIMESCDFFSMQQISDPGDIYPVFRELFQKKPA